MKSSPLKISPLDGNGFLERRFYLLDDPQTRLPKRFPPKSAIMAERFRRATRSTCLAYLL